MDSAKASGKTEIDQKYHRSKKQSPERLAREHSIVN